MKIERRHRGECVVVDRLEVAIYRISMLFGVLSATAIAVMPLLIGYSVFMRYFAGNPLALTEELSAFLLMSCIFLGLPYAAVHGQHLHFSLVLNRVPNRIRPLLSFLTNVAAAIFFLILAKLTFDFTVTGYRLNSHTETARIYEVPWRAVMPVSSSWLSVMLLFFAARDLRAMMRFVGGPR